MRNINALLTDAFDLLLTSLGSFDPFWILTIVSVPAGVLMVLIFRLTSDQAKIKETKQKMQGHLIEIRLFGDNTLIVLSALKKVLVFNARYLKYSVKPMLYLVLPVSLLLVQLDGWFGYRPLNVGESAIVSVQLSEDGPKELSRVSIEADPGVVIETPALRILDTGEVDWRIHAETAGEHILTINAFGHRTTKNLVVGRSNLVRVSRFKTGSALADLFMSPGEPPIEKASSIKRIGVEYPQRDIRVFRWRNNWIVLFFALSVAAGFIASRFLKIQI